MNNYIRIHGMSLLLPEASKGISTDKTDVMIHIVTAEEIDRFSAEETVKKTEKIASELSFSVSSLLERTENASELSSDETGISFGTSQGCFSALKTAADGIKEKGVKGMKPMDATLCILCGAASKSAMKHGLKAFNVTNFDGVNAGLDALIYACDALRDRRARYAVAGGGDETDSTYGMLLLERTDDQSNGTYIMGYAKGNVFGSESKKYIISIIDNAIEDAGLSRADISCIADSSPDKELTETVIGEYFSGAKLHMLPYEYCGTAAARGILALAGTLGRQKSYSMTICLSEEGYFSCIIVGNLLQ